MIDEEKLSTIGCGLFHCPIDDAYRLMPELSKVFDSAPKVKNPIVDVKIHMLMPNQWPCIPNWHCDFIPRDNNKKQLLNKRDASQKMYLLLSGPPFTEFRDGRVIKPWEWTEFTQFDEHRGIVSDKHCWRLFVRITPGSLCKPAIKENRTRKHIQVYLDASGFKW